MKRMKFYTEWAYLIGLLVLALGTALMEKADFGVSMVVAPAYLIYLKLSPLLPFFSFGMAEYLFQALLIALLALILRRMKRAYLFSFVTAVIYGFMLDGAMALVARLGADAMAVRVICYLAGMALCALGVALLFHSYIAPEAYELFVKELADRLKRPTHRVKTVYDLASCALGVALSFIFFGFGVFRGVKLGTVLCALVNGWMIGRVARFLDARFDFCDALGLRARFER